MKMLGEVDLLGLDALGTNPGMDGLFGTMIGGGLTSLFKTILEKRGVSHAGFWGLGAGAGAAAYMYYRQGSRHAGLNAFLGSVLASGAIDFVLGKLADMVGLSASPATEAPAGVGLPQVQYLQGLGLPQVEYLQGLGLPQVEYLQGLGVPTVAPAPPSYGTMSGVHGAGVAGPQLGDGAPPVDLLGQPTATSQQIELMGGPVVSGLAQHYGATLLGPLA